MKFSEWFDPYNREHLDAYRHCEKTGFWPENFIPDNIEGQAHYFAIEAMHILGKAWLRYTLLMNTKELENLK
jgi:hypothetical protein